MINNAYKSFYILRYFSFTFILILLTEAAQIHILVLYLLII